jgi:hypothetical protein
METMRTKSLMSPVDAAGYAMAPSEEDMAEVICHLPDDALRHGHDAAAAKPASSSLPYVKRDRTVVIVDIGRVHQFTNRSHWFRDFLASLWGPAHA